MASAICRCGLTEGQQRSKIRVVQAFVRPDGKSVRHTCDVIAQHARASTTIFLQTDHSIKAFRHQTQAVAVQIALRERLKNSLQNDSAFALHLVELGMVKNQFLGETFVEVGFSADGWVDKQTEAVPVRV